MKNTKHYTKTVFVRSLSDFQGMRAGQWVDARYLPKLTIASTSRGQFMGMDAQGLPIINYAVRYLSKPAWRVHFMSNKPARQFAKIKGD